MTIASPPASRVFVSCENIDHEFPSRLMAFLREEGFDVRHSPRNPMAGPDPRWKTWYEEGLREECTASQIALIVVTDSWDSSSWMGIEAEEILRSHRDGRLRAWHCVDLRTEARLAEGMEPYFRNPLPLDLGTILEAIRSPSAEQATDRQPVESERFARKFPEIDPFSFWTPLALGLSMAIATLALAIFHPDFDHWATRLATAATGIGMTFWIALVSRSCLRLVLNGEHISDGRTTLPWIEVREVRQFGFSLHLHSARGKIVVRPFAYKDPSGLARTILARSTIATSRPPKLTIPFSRE